MRKSGLQKRLADLPIMNVQCTGTDLITYTSQLFFLLLLLPFLYYYSYYPAGWTQVRHIQSRFVNTSLSEYYSFVSTDHKLGTHGVLETTITLGGYCEAQETQCSINFIQLPSGSSNSCWVSASNFFGRCRGVLTVTITTRTSLKAHKAALEANTSLKAIKPATFLLL